jgi:hypothetical protein
MVIDEHVKKQVEDYFRSRYDFEDRVKVERSGYTDLKKTIAQVLDVKPKDVNDAYREWKKQRTGEDNSDIVVEIVESLR